MELFDKILFTIFLLALTGGCICYHTGKQKVENIFTAVWLGSTVVWCVVHLLHAIWK